MTPRQFFEGRLRGYGVVRSLTGRILRRFEVEMLGVWSEEHRALHLDETYRYLGGPEAFHRRWAIHTDEEGYILGHDALEVARLRGRQRGEDFRLVFDRQHSPVRRMFDPPQVVDFVAVGPDEFMMIGRAQVLGFPVASIHAAIRREAASA